MGLIQTREQQSNPITDGQISEIKNYKFIREIPGVKLPDDIEGKNSEVFRVLSYNILAECYTYYNCYLGLVSRFKYCDNQFLNFKFRSQIVMTQLEQFDCDIMCLQEVDNLKNFYLPAFRNLGYQFVYINRVGREDSALIAWKPEKFTLVKKVEIVLEERLMEERSTIHSVSDYRRPDVGIIAELKSVETGMSYIVTCSHLFWNPKFECVKYYQAMQVMLKLEEHFPLKTAKIIWGGDFNSVPKSNVVSMINGSDTLRTDTNLISAHHKNDFNALKRKYITEGQKVKRRYRSSYENFRSKRGEAKHPKFTNYTPEFKDCIDYIFYNDKAGLCPLKLQQFPKEEELKVGEGCPNRLYPSDHLPLIVEFKSWEC